MDNNIVTRDKYSYLMVKKVLNSVYNYLDINQKTFNEAIKIDEQDGHLINFEELKRIIKKYTEYKEVLTDDDIKSQKTDGIGNVAVVYDGRPEILIEMVVKCLYTNNNITLFPELGTATSKCILEIFDGSMKEIGYNNNVIQYEENIEELYNNQSNYDVAVFIGDIFEYSKFKKRFNKDIIYSGFGSVQVFCDNEYFEDIIEKMNEYCFENSLSIISHEETDIDEIIKKMNKITVIDCVAIFTKDSKKALQLIKNIKAHKIFVNTYPLDNYSFEFDETKLLLNKQIITG